MRGQNRLAASVAVGQRRPIMTAPNVETPAADKTSVDVPGIDP